jgi:hypothetical protein
MRRIKSGRGAHDLQTRSNTTQLQGKSEYLFWRARLVWGSALVHLFREKGNDRRHVLHHVPLFLTIYWVAPRENFLPANFEFRRQDKNE